MNTSRRTHIFRFAPWLFLPCCIFLSMFVIWPTLVVLSRSFNRSSLFNVLSDSQLRQMLWFTTWQALLSTLGTLAIGLPAALVLSRYAFKSRQMIRALTFVPFVLPTVVVGIAFASLAPAQYQSGPLPLILAHIYLNIAVVVRVVGSRWEKLPTAFNDNAALLGATPFTNFRTITLPLLRSSIIGAGSIVFIFCFSTYGAARVLAGPRFPTIETEIYRYAFFLGNMPQASALVVWQLFVILLVLALTHRQKSISLAQQNLMPLSSERQTKRLFFSVAATLIAVGTLLPIAILFTDSLQSYEGFTFSYWATSDMWTSFFTSLSIALFAAVMALLFGTGSALAIAYSTRTRFHMFVQALTSLPIVISAVALGLGYLLAFRSDPVNWRGSIWLLPVAHSAVALPFVVRIITPAAREIQPELRENALLLGASPWEAWKSIDLRFLLRPLAIAASFAFTISLGEFGASSLLTRHGHETLAMRLGQLLSRPGEQLQKQAIASACLLAFSCIAIALIVEYAVQFNRKKRTQ
ncbi:MAG: ABC transporter permease subunit [Actinobacteria bacterium]|nr:ABC transporter permease subunit [Actinomycetota bacterium]